MARYKNSSYITYSSDAMFDTTYSPGTDTPHSGIYRCDGCGREIASNAGNPLPSQNRSQHDSTTHGTIRWRLSVYAQG